MEVYRNDVGLDNFESTFCSILESDYNDPDKIFFNDKLQEIDSPYFSVENFKTVSDQLNGDKFSILHLNIRSLNKNIDNLRDFLASLKDKFSVIVLGVTKQQIKILCLTLKTTILYIKLGKIKRGEGFVFIFIKVYILR